MVSWLVTRVKSAVLACRALLRQVNTGRTSLSIIRVATKLYVFKVLSIPIASGSPVSSWMCSSESFSGQPAGIILALRALFVHCRAHVLQLCCVSAARCLPSLKKVFTTLMSVWNMFHYSPKKFSALKEVQALVNHPQLKMIKHSD